MSAAVQLQLGRPLSWGRGDSKVAPLTSAMVQSQMAKYGRSVLEARPLQNCQQGAIAATEGSDIAQLNLVGGPSSTR